jgi:hypothetical protein
MKLIFETKYRYRYLNVFKNFLKIFLICKFFLPSVRTRSQKYEKARIVQKGQVQTGFGTLANSQLR